MSVKPGMYYTGYTISCKKCGDKQMAVYNEGTSSYDKSLDTLMRLINLVMLPSHKDHMFKVTSVFVNEHELPESFDQTDTLSIQPENERSW